MSEVLNRKLPGSFMPIGESWDLVDRRDTNSIVSDGELAGVSLNVLVETYGTALMGRKAEKFNRFPLIVKLIDAGDRLSLQVHPDEESCREIGGGAELKNEVSYVISVRNGAKMFAGLKPGVTPEQLFSMLDSPEVEFLMQSFESKEGDAYFISPGMIHAIGADNLILEIMQNSDTTYRVNDWGRLGPDGRPRALHKEEGRSSIRFGGFAPLWIPGEGRECDCSSVFDVVTQCPYFKVQDLRLCSVWEDDTADGESFHLLSAVKNCFEVGNADRKNVIAPGETVLIPACFGAYTITPLDGSRGTVIKTTL